MLGIFKKLGLEEIEGQSMHRKTHIKKFANAIFEGQRLAFESSFFSDGVDIPELKGLEYRLH